MTWKRVEPISSGTASPPLVADVQRHLTRREFAYYGGFQDPVTQIHECSHGINAKLRNSTRERDNWFYCLNNTAAGFSEPPCRKRDIASSTPREFREHRLYALYILGASDWEDTPLYIYDEWVCYSNGAMLRRSASEIEYALVFAFYALALLKVARTKQYTQLTDLSLFFIWNMARLEQVAEGQERLVSLLQEKANDQLDL